MDYYDRIPYIIMVEHSIEYIKEKIKSNPRSTDNERYSQEIDVLEDHLSNLRLKQSVADMVSK